MLGPLDAPRARRSAACGETTTFRSSTTVPIDATSGTVVTSIWSAIFSTASRSSSQLPVDVDGHHRGRGDAPRVDELDEAREAERDVHLGDPGVVERPQRHLRPGLADRLGGDDPDRLVRVDLGRPEPAGDLADDLRGVRRRRAGGSGAWPSELVDQRRRERARPPPAAISWIRGAEVADRDRFFSSAIVTPLRTRGPLRARRPPRPPLPRPLPRAGPRPGGPSPPRSPAGAPSAPSGRRSSLARTRRPRTCATTSSSGTACALVRAGRVDAVLAVAGTR